MVAQAVFRRHPAAMMTFGVRTLIDLLSWIVACLLCLKVVSTLIILIVDKQMRDRPGWGSMLWWTTKITPLVAVPCAIWIAVLEREAGLARLFIAVGLYVVIAVSLKIRQRRRRMARHMAAASPVHL